MAALIGTKFLRIGLRRAQPRVLAESTTISICGKKTRQVYHYQVATIVSPASYIHQVEKPAPWPYKLKRFTVLDQFYDSTEDRLDENSKVIVVDGNLAVGKTDFAEKLADSLQFHLMPHLSEKDFFYNSLYDMDLRWVNHALPKEHHFYDLRAWLSDSEPTLGLGAKLQLIFYKERLKQYAQGLHHLMSTGQGIIIERSPFSDQAFAEAMHMCGFMSRPALRYYREFKRQTIFDFWKPHLTIYLDAPTDFVMKKLKGRNHLAEKGSKVLTEQFVSEIDRVYKKSILPEMKRHGEVLVYDAAEMEGMEVIVEDIERLKFDWDPNDEKKFQQWHDNKAEDILSYFRRYWGSTIEIDKLFNLPPPWHVPEMMDSPETVQARKAILEHHPRTAYYPGYNPSEVDAWTLVLKP